MSEPRGNAPCPCGSNKKYKKCCGSGKQNATTHPASTEEIFKFDVSRESVEYFRSESAKLMLSSDSRTNRNDFIRNMVETNLPLIKDNSEHAKQTGMADYVIVIIDPESESGKALAEMACPGYKTRAALVVLWSRSGALNNLKAFFAGEKLQKAFDEIPYKEKQFIVVGVSGDEFRIAVFDE